MASIYRVYFGGSTDNTNSISLYDTAEDATFNDSNNSGGTDSMTARWNLNPGANQLRYGGSVVHSGFDCTSDTCRFDVAANGTVTFYINGVLEHTFAASASGKTLRFVIANSTTSRPTNDISWTTVGTPANMTLVSTAVTAASAPSTAYVTVQAQPVDSITLNTDLVAEVSRDGGTTWSTVTLAAGATNASFVNYEGSVDISGQPSGTSMVLRTTTANNKEVRVSGHVLRWG